MLTPVDIQQKRFKTGIGFDKKDVSAFFDEVSRSYGELYKSNAELKEKVITLTDQVQHYKIKEEDLEQLATDALNDACYPGNPREATKEQVIEMFRMLMA